MFGHFPSRQTAVVWWQVLVTGHFVSGRSALAAVNSWGKQSTVIITFLCRQLRFLSTGCPLLLSIGAALLRYGPCRPHPPNLQQPTILQMLPYIDTDVLFSAMHPLSTKTPVGCMSREDMTLACSSGYPERTEEAFRGQETQLLSSMMRSIPRTLTNHAHPSSHKLISLDLFTVTTGQIVGGFQSVQSLQSRWLIDIL